MNNFGLSSYATNTNNYRGVDFSYGGYMTSNNR